MPEVKTEDEVAEMNRAAIAMAENLRMIIEDIKQALNAMANGDWTVKFLYPDLYAGDLDELKEALRDIKYKMNEALYNVNSVSGQVSMGAGSLADAAQSLAEGATEQAGAVQQLQATIFNLHTSVQEAFGIGFKIFGESIGIGRPDRNRLLHNPFLCHF